MRHVMFAAVFATLGMGAPAALAAPVFVEDFEDGAADGWAPSGGDARLTQYAGNTSLRLSGRTAVVRSVSSLGYTNVTVAAAMAADSLERGEHCLVEVSADGGQTWIQVLRVQDGQDDAVTLHTSALHNSRLDNANLLIGARAAGDADDDRCWIDNVRITGAAPVTSGPRAELGRGALIGGTPRAAPSAMSAFAPAADAAPPRHVFRGLLMFDGAMDGLTLHRDALHFDDDPSLRLRTLPRLELALAQNGEDLIPLRRGPIPSDHPSWEFAVEPGRVWSEPGDDGLSRAALPFALVETLANCTHNGVLTFLFGDDGEISNVAWQIASETCAYLQFDAWGGGAASYRPSADGADAAITTFRAERAARMPTRPFADLATAYPGLDLSAFASPADIDPTHLTTYGVIVDGMHYLGGCDTRAGPYPFCEALLAPSYSLAKSLVGGLGLMRLELLHPGAMLAQISDHVEACIDWRGVSFEHALDMTTGRYRSPADQADENGMIDNHFFSAPTHAEKIALACTLFPRREAAGRRWVYHTTDTYVLGAAMAGFWRDHHGDDAEFFDDVLVQGVYEPLHLSPTIRATRRTADAARQPFTGWGLTLTRDDIAKLGAYLAAPFDARPLVAPSALAAALQGNAADRGLQAGSDLLRYNNGFWAYNAQSRLGCADTVWIPFLSGFGGVIVALMPNGVVYYYVSDGHDYAWARAVQAANEIAPMCARTHP